MSFQQVQIEIKIEGLCSLPQMSYRSCHQILLAQKLTPSYPLMDLVQIQFFFVTLGLDTKAIVYDT